MQSKKKKIILFAIIINMYSEAHFTKIRKLNYRSYWFQLKIVFNEYPNDESVVVDNS